MQVFNRLIQLAGCLPLFIFRFLKESIHISNMQEVKGAVSYIQSPDCDKHSEWLVRIFEGKVGTKWRDPKNQKVQHTSLDINGKDTVYMGDDIEFAG
eukprot:TRINITY_DN33199_c0_g1_i1.p1 TRINITY_DN33199_c0_g1~~TRINITY_DN33199_c0_g1_i1.p1  ORF type:complete len:111 (+),score=5.40 TRINITY_DN33199_c0_g1_i1:43-333(+)